MKPATLVHVNSADEKRVSQLLQAIEAKRRQVAQLTVAVEHLKADVDSFQHQYHAHVGRYYVELDKVELETKAYRLRLQLHREKVSEEEIEARVTSCFKANRARIEEAEEAEESLSSPLPEEKAKHLQKLYRQLAKQYHPDKTVDAAEQQQRQQLMPLINRAYQEQDIQTLERLSIGDAKVEAPREETSSEKRARLQAELRALNRATGELRLEMNRLKSGRAYQLKQQVENARESGTELLTALAKDLERKLTARRGQLARLMDIWHRAITSHERR